MKAEDMILISVDDHICEPADMFDAMPAAYKDRAPRVETAEKGHQQWWYSEAMGRNLGLNAVAGKPPEMFNINSSRFDEMRPGCYNVDERVRDMSAGGQLAGLNFPNWTGFAGQVLSEGLDRDVNLVMIRAYNDWHVDERCGSHPDRFIPCGMVPLWDADLAVAEVRRLAAKGVRAITFSENPAACQGFTPLRHTNVSTGNHLLRESRGAGRAVDALKFLGSSVRCLQRRRRGGVLPYRIVVEGDEHLV